MIIVHKIANKNKVINKYFNYEGFVFTERIIFIT